MNKISRENISLPREIAFKSDMVPVKEKLIFLETEIKDLEDKLNTLMPKEGQFPWKDLQDKPSATINDPGLPILSNSTNSNSVETAVSLKAISGVYQGGFVPKSRTINGKTLDKDIILTASDIGSLDIPTVDGLLAGLSSGTFVKKTTTVQGISLNTASITIPSTSFNGTREEDSAAAIPYVFDNGVKYPMYRLDTAKFTLEGKKFVNGITITTVDANAYSKEEYVATAIAKLQTGFPDYRGSFGDFNYINYHGMTSWDPVTRDLHISLKNIYGYTRDEFPVAIKTYFKTPIIGIRLGAKVLTTGTGPLGSVITGIKPALITADRVVINRPLMAGTKNIDTGVITWVTFNA